MVAFMTWIKICGTTNLEDALLAVDAGANAVGFVFYEKSSRNVRVEAVRDIVAQLPATMEKVGVFVDDPAEQIADKVREAGLTAAQLHLSEVHPRDVRDFAVIKERAGDAKVILSMSAHQLPIAPEEWNLFITKEAQRMLYALMFDSGTASQPGGTGETFDWEEQRALVQGASYVLPVIVAGGLTPANVARAIKTFQPFGVDVASGVESKPGKKDPTKVQGFVRAVRNMEKPA